MPWPKLPSGFDAAEWGGPPAAPPKPPWARCVAHATHSERRTTLCSAAGPVRRPRPRRIARDRRQASVGVLCGARPAGRRPDRSCARAPSRCGPRCRNDDGRDQRNPGHGIPSWFGTLGSRSLELEPSCSGTRRRHRSRLCRLPAIDAILRPDVRAERLHRRDVRFPAMVAIRSRSPAASRRRVAPPRRLLPNWRVSPPSPGRWAMAGSRFSAIPWPPTSSCATPSPHPP